MKVNSDSYSKQSETAEKIQLSTLVESYM